jgi:hypothetical protein
MFAGYSIDILLYRYTTMNSFPDNSGDANPVFWLSSEKAISSKNSPCHHTTRFKQSDPDRSSRKDYCKLLALYAIPSCD